MNCNEEVSSSLGFTFWIPVAMTILLAIWNLIQQRGIEKLKREIEKQLFKHRLQFEEEFKIYKNLWSILVELRILTSSLQPIMDYTEEGKTYEETIKSRLAKVGEIGNKLFLEVDSNKPFYAKQIYGKIQELLKAVKKEHFRVMRGEKMKDNYWEEGETNLKLIHEKSEEVCEAIRERITV